MNSSGLGSISFPIYVVGKIKPEEENGVLFLVRLQEGEEYKLIIDDKNLSGATLARRRLELLATTELAKLTNAIFFIGDMVKLATPNTWFIDSLGKLFIYRKTRSAKLIFRKIEQVHLIPTGGAIIVAQGVQSRFKCLYAPNTEKYAGLLNLGHAYILYGLYENEPKETRRMI